MILFSHRPKLGVSVAVMADDGLLRFAVAVTHNRLDSFSRSRARQILTGRLETTSSKLFRTSLDAQEFMKRFKAWFKPTSDESDNIFPKKLHKRRQKIVELILAKAEFIVADSESI